MKILAFDTCFSTCPLAIVDETGVIVKYHDDQPFKQAGKLIPYIEKSLKDSGLDYKDLYGIAVTTGPGSFTGIRIGLSAANAVSLVTNIKVIGITTLESMAFQAFKQAKKKYERICVVIDSYKQQLSLQEFNVSESLPEVGAVNAPELIAIEEFSKIKSSPDICFTGNAKEIIKDKVTSDITDNINIDATYLAELAIQKIKAGQGSNLSDPVYLRPPDAKIPKDPLKRNND